jgi:hypothetical protein
MGSLTPQMPTSLLLPAAPTAARAAASAARLTVLKSLIAKNIATSPGDATTLPRGELITEPRTSEGGPLLPSLWSPRPFFAFVYWRGPNPVPLRPGRRQATKGMRVARCGMR